MLPRRESTVGASQRPGSKTRRTPIELRPEPPPFRGSSLRSDLAITPMPEPRTSPKFRSGVRRPPSAFRLGRPSRGSWVESRLRNRCRLLRSPPNRFDDIHNLRHPAPSCKLRGSLDFASQYVFSRGRITAQPGTGRRQSTGPLSGPSTPGFGAASGGSDPDAGRQTLRRHP